MSPRHEGPQRTVDFLAELQRAQEDGAAGLADVVRQVQRWERMERVVMHVVREASLVPGLQGDRVRVEDWIDSLQDALEDRIVKERREAWDRLASVVNYLLGSGELLGLDFSDAPPMGMGPYWWRTHLREAWQKVSQP